MGIVFDLQRSALQDGPGIRTTVFLKGCPMRCRWCHNPESWELEPQSAVSGDPPRTWGREWSVEEVMAVVRKDRRFHQVSGGGMTLSGGEPTRQADFCLALLEAARGEGIHTCLDTCGCFPSNLLDRLLRFVDLFLYDLKATGEERHRELTGIPASVPLTNLEAILERGGKVLLRCPMVPGVNDFEEHFSAIAALSRKHPGITGIEILPYHRSGESKWAELGMDAPDLGAREPEEGQKKAWEASLQRLGALRWKIL